MDHRSINEAQVVRHGSSSPVHIQVRKIIDEEFSDKVADWLPGKLERRPVAAENLSRQLSRSPLGVSRRPISVGDS